MTLAPMARSWEFADTIVNVSRRLCAASMRSNGSLCGWGNDPSSNGVRTGAREFDKPRSRHPTGTVIHGRRRCGKSPDATLDVFVFLWSSLSAVPCAAPRDPSPLARYEHN